MPARLGWANAPAALLLPVFGKPVAYVPVVLIVSARKEANSPT